jgi:hypothetical protein
MAVTLPNLEEIDMTAKAPSSSQDVRRSWMSIALVPLFVTGGSVIQYDWHAVWWRLAPAVFCACYAIYAALCVLPSSGGPVPARSISKIESAWVAANIWSVAGLMVNAEDLFSLRYGIIVSLLTVLAVMNKVIPVENYGAE